MAGINRPIGATLLLAGLLSAGAPSLAPGHDAVRTASLTACAGDYARGPLKASPTLRFGIDPEPAGSAGSGQNRVRPVNEAKTLRSLKSLRPRGKQLVLRVNRLFEADGEAGIRRFARIIRRYTGLGFDTELQVRYHPTARQAGDIAAWQRYVRHVVDAFGPNRHVVAMTITNEINVPFSPNTSDGHYPRAEEALVRGIIAAHREARRRGFAQLRFGFTFAYRFVPAIDAAVFTGLKRGGAAFRNALGFVGVDYYPEVYPGRSAGLGAATRQMMGAIRRCFMPLGGLGPGIPIWITESGYDSTPGLVSMAQQRAAVIRIVGAIHGAAKTFGVTDYRWFNLRDNVSTTAVFAETSGLETDRYRRKPSFTAYRSLIARYGAGLPKPAGQ
jgi:hypothetical protein